MAAATAPRVRSRGPLRCLCPQPRQITEIKDFLLTARRKDAKSVKVRVPRVGAGPRGARTRRGTPGRWCRPLPAAAGVHEPAARRSQIKKTAGVIKFKVRCSRYLYTLCVADADKADKLKQSLPPGACHGEEAVALLPCHACHTACVSCPVVAHASAPNVPWWLMLLLPMLASLPRVPSG